MNRLTFGGVAGTGLWVASAIKVLGYTWGAFTNSYDKSAFQIGGSGSGSGSHDVPIIPPVKRKQKPGGKKTKLPRLRPIPVIPPHRRQYPSGAPAPVPAGSKYPEWAKKRIKGYRPGYVLARSITGRLIWVNPAIPGLGGVPSVISPWDLTGPDPVPEPG